MDSTCGALSRTVLAVNAGSTSIKFALFEAHSPYKRIFDGAIDKVGATGSCFRVDDGQASFARTFTIADYVTAVRVLTDWLQERVAPQNLAAIGHRVVYGGVRFRTTQKITPALLDALFAARSYDAQHLPQEQLLIETLARAFPDTVNVACFDTSFHRHMPQVASMLPIPRHFFAAGVVRLGFHGLSCACMMRELARCAGAQAAAGKVVLAHLGGGCSITAVKGGTSVDTSMGLTPAGGMIMGTRSGDVDPGLAWRLKREHDMDAAQFNHMINHESGLRGVSGTSGDLRHLLAQEAVDPAAADAVAMFCYQARKQIGAMACAMEGMETLVLAGGIGENLPVARARICAGLAFLGVEIDAALNAQNAAIISTTASGVTVRLIASDEQVMIAEETASFIASLDSGSLAEAGHA